MHEKHCIKHEDQAVVKPSLQHQTFAGKKFADKFGVKEKIACAGSTKT
jgi:hypothetical protein